MTSSQRFTGIFLRTHLVGCLVVGGLACRPAVEPYPPPGVDVRHYDVALQLDPATRTLHAHTTLDVHRPDTLERLVLAFEGLVLDTVRVDGNPVAATRRGEWLHVPLPQGKTASQVELVYHGTPPTGLYRMRHGPQMVTFTDTWPDEGRGWLPGIHHPADPATWAFSLTLPPGHEAVASGTPTGIDTLGDALQYRWRLDVPAPLYTLAFAVADFTTTEVALGDTLPVRYVLLADEAERVGLLRRTPEALAFFSALIGPYPFDQYAAVQVPLRYAGMENASAAFLQAALFDDAQAVEAVQVHELAHQWFGNRVPIAAWTDLWLSEGTATYLTTLFYEHADGLDAARRRWIELASWTPGRRRTHRALVPRAGTPPEALLSWVPYNKGASVLHLLRLKLGDEAFFNALRAVYTQHAGRPLSTAAFQAILEQQGKIELSEFFAYWVYGQELPTLRTAWSPTTRTLAWTIENDAGTLAGIPFELRLRQGARTRYVEATAGRVELAGWEITAPEVLPVGVLMQIE